MQPIPDETHADGFRTEMQHFVESFAARTAPSQTFADGVIDNAIVDAGYRSMNEKSSMPIDFPLEIAANA